MEINSKRQYKIAMIENETATIIEKTTIENILTDDGFEYQYALQGEIDEILDLKLGESMYFQANRDDKNSKGVILRIK